MGVITSQSCDNFEISKAPGSTVLHGLKLTVMLVASPLYGCRDT